MHASNDFQARVEEQFLVALRQQLLGLRSKVETEMSEDNYHLELQRLSEDLVYPKFHLDTPEYVLIRLMGRISVSIGRRLGELYDKTPRLVAAARFGLSPDEVAPSLGGLKLDVGIRFANLAEADVNHVRSTARQHLRCDGEFDGIGIEIRFIFNPNDSSRLRKDVDMCNHLREERLLPVYLVFSTLSPRDEAIARLERAGWQFLIGEEANAFTEALFGVDITRILERPRVRQEIQEEVHQILSGVFDSFAFRAVSERHGL